MKEYEVVKKFVETLSDVAKKKDIKRLKVSYKDIKVFIDMAGETINSADFFRPAAKTELQTSNLKGPIEEDKVYIKDNFSDKGEVVVSPIVGTFYSSPAPTKPSFVSIGDSVKKGDILFIIESMKLMNEIKCEFDGVVVDILVRSGDGVEYGQPIMIIQKK